MSNWIYRKPDSVFSQSDRHRSGERRPLFLYASDYSARFSNRTRKLLCGPQSWQHNWPTFPYLILLRAEFGCFHSVCSPEASLAGLKIIATKTFSLFHCSSACTGGSLTPALSCGVRTFLERGLRDAGRLLLAELPDAFRPLLATALQIQPGTYRNFLKCSMVRRLSLIRSTWD